jgi:hypothetical protein
MLFNPRYLPKEDDKEGVINSCLTIAALFSIVLAAVFFALRTAKFSFFRA